MTWTVGLRLGRVSNLPTVWTNTLAAVVLAGGAIADPRTVPLLAAMSLAYIGGMYLNDAFDAEIDARQRPERPIPSGQVARRTVFVVGFAMLGGCVALLAATGLLPRKGTGLWPVLGGLALVGTIVLYDWRHKGNPLSPVVMGLCRVLVYVAAGLSVAMALPAALLAGAGVLWCHVIGLTYAAKQESLGRVENLWPLAFLAVPVVFGLWRAIARPDVLPFWILFAVLVAFALRILARRRPGDVPRAVVALIAGISLLDAVLIADAAGARWALAGVGGFVLTLALQRHVPGT